MRDVYFDEYYDDVMLRGLTGKRRITMITALKAANDIVNSAADAATKAYRDNLPEIARITREYEDKERKLSNTFYRKLQKLFPFVIIDTKVFPTYFNESHVNSTHLRTTREKLELKLNELRGELLVAAPKKVLANQSPTPEILDRVERLFKEEK